MLLLCPEEFYSWYDAINTLSNGQSILGQSGQDSMG